MEERARTSITRVSTAEQGRGGGGNVRADTSDGKTHTRGANAVRIILQCRIGPGHGAVG